MFEVAIVVVGTLIVLALTGALGWIGSLLDKGPPLGRLVLVGKPAVSNDARDAATIDDKLIRTSESAPQIDIAVRNTGDDPIQISEARVTILHSARLVTCKVGGGDIPQSRPYEIDLAIDPAPDERVVREDVREEVPPGHAYRVLLAFDSEEPALTDQLFALHVELIAEPPDQVVDVGRFVLGVPEPVSRGGGVLPEDEYALNPETTYALEESWCYRRNFAELRRLTRQPGERDEEIAALTDAAMFPGWSPEVTPEQARTAVEPLLDSDAYPGNSLVAVFAAEQTGDEDFAQKTRERAAAKIVREVEFGLEEGESMTYLAAEIRQALKWAPSPEAEDLLRRVKAELQAQLEERLAE